MAPVLSLTRVAGSGLRREKTRSVFERTEIPPLHLVRSLLRREKTPSIMAGVFSSYGVYYRV